MTSEWPIDPRDFSAYYSFAPAALAIRECVRLRAVREIALAEPLLDVGCGDGLFARLAYPQKQAWGIDINPSEVQRAQRTAAYQTLICGNIVGVHLPTSFFGSAIANCSLEHVPDIHGALVNICGALKPAGQLVLIVPTPDWTYHLAIPEALRAAGLTGLAQAYGDALDRVFSHVHLYDAAGWRERLYRAGFDVDEVRPIAMRPTSWAFDLMLYPSLLGWVTRQLTGRWIALPALRPLTVDLSRAIVNAIGRMAPDADSPAEYLIVAHKRGG
ncbi:MAG: class I SAM-dependent methyltransferase [Labilithrix sp.]|nr:class I SAM-dependent methyltransferase [Labilithrix sp.]MCW5814013.1 class I SAM-dependent methyltransferase [Labilithrix sp.]